MIKKAGSSNVLPGSQTGSWTQWTKWCEWVWMVDRNIQYCEWDREKVLHLHPQMRPGIIGWEIWVFIKASLGKIGGFTSGKSNLWTVWCGTVSEDRIAFDSKLKAPYGRRGPSYLSTGQLPARCCGQDTKWKTPVSARYGRAQSSIPQVFVEAGFLTDTITLQGKKSLNSLEQS